MTHKTCIVLLVISLTAVLAKRRSVRFMNCPSTRSSSNVLNTTKLVRSRIECSVSCLNDVACLSASYCKTREGHTCELSGEYIAGGCTGQVTDGDCMLSAIPSYNYSWQVNPCKNRGTFNPENRTCHCVEGFVGDYCHRRYRDCQETPAKGALYTIQPFGSDYTFQWKCGPSATFTKLTEYWSSRIVNYTFSWEQIKQGIEPYAGYFFPGPESLHQLTAQGVYDLFVLLVVASKPNGWVIYKNFRVDSEAEGYACHWDSFDRNVTTPFKSEDYLDGFGALGDSSKSMNGTRFGTFDKDINGCACANFNFPWWYNPVGCTFVTFDPSGLKWPTNRNGTVEMEKIDIAITGLTNVYWRVEDDLVL